MRSMAADYFDESSALNFLSRSGFEAWLPAGFGLP
jgi:hypothetical protein